MFQHPCARAAVITVVAAAAVSLLGTAAAAAAPASVFTATPRGPIAGDVTGDGIADQVVLGYLGDRATVQCAVQVTAGRAGGGSAPAVTIAVPVRGSLVQCPDLGTVVAGPKPASNRLALTFFAVPPNDAVSVQVFSLVGGTATYRAGVAGQRQPSQIGSQDFNGDGWGDVWENTDQGLGFSAWTATGSTFRSLTSLAGPRVSFQFADINHSKGTDLLLANLGGPQTPPSAVVVDGLTRRSQTLASGNTPDGQAVDRYQLSLVDLDHDAYLDIRVDAVQSGGQVIATSYFLNQSQGGHWSFVPSSSPVI